MPDDTLVLNQIYVHPHGMHREVRGGAKGSHEEATLLKLFKRQSVYCYGEAFSD